MIVTQDGGFGFFGNQTALPVFSSRIVTDFMLRPVQEMAAGVGFAGLIAAIAEDIMGSLFVRMKALGARDELCG